MKSSAALILLLLLLLHLSAHAKGEEARLRQVFQAPEKATPGTLLGRIGDGIGEGRTTDHKNIFF